MAIKNHESQLEQDIKPEEPHKSKLICLNTATQQPSHSSHLLHPEVKAIDTDTTAEKKKKKAGF